MRLHQFQTPALDVGGRLHAPAASHPKKAVLVPIEYVTGLGPHSRSGNFGEEKNNDLAVPGVDTCY